MFTFLVPSLLRLLLHRLISVSSALITRSCCLAGHQPLFVRSIFVSSSNMLLLLLSCHPSRFSIIVPALELRPSSCAASVVHSLVTCRCVRSDHFQACTVAVGAGSPLASTCAPPSPPLRSLRLPSSDLYLLFVRIKCSVAHLSACSRCVDWLMECFTSVFNQKLTTPSYCDDHRLVRDAIMDQPSSSSDFLCDARECRLHRPSPPFARGHLLFQR